MGLLLQGEAAGADAIVSCGDLPSNYLTFLVTMANRPLFYVHGNHDTRYDSLPPEGCDCIDGRVVEFKGYRILGLGGCMEHSGGAHQYTERQMKKRIAKLRRQAKGGVDLLVTHAPAREVGDLDDLCHRGFVCFRALMDEYKPLYHLHGHVHLQYAPKLPRTSRYGDTTVVNASGKYFIDLPDRPDPPQGREFRPAALLPLRLQKNCFLEALKQK